MNKRNERAQDASRLAPLVERTLEFAAEPDQERKKRLWARHQALEPTEKIPVCVTYEGIPAPQWDYMFGPDHLQCTGELARRIEFELKKRIWMAENVEDDHIVWPYLWVPAVDSGTPDWGVPLDWTMPEEELGAKKWITPFADEIDLSRLRQPEVEIDEPATERRLDQVRELVGGQLTVVPFYGSLGYAPFEIAVKMRGMDRLLYDVYDQPEQVHALMDLITTALVAHHQRREAQGWISCVADPTNTYQALRSPWRIHCSYLPPDYGARPSRLSDEWAYVTDQSSAGLGPAMYADFINRYHRRLASFFVNATVYYHGCENLDQKVETIAELPHLRRFHVSPYSSVARAVEVLQGEAVMEVHAHPGRVLMAGTPEAMRDELVELIAAAQGQPMDLNLSDIHSIDGRPETLSTWTRIAQELAWAA